MKAALIVAVAVAAAEFGSAFNVSVIRPYNVSDVTVSGVSSGGYMAVQMHIAHSSIISGCAAFAAGPYYCAGQIFYTGMLISDNFNHFAESNAFFAEHKCMAIDAGVPKVESLVAFTYANAEILLVDSPLHLRNDRVYLFSGTADSSVDPIVVGALRSYYSHFMESSSIISDFDEPAEHCFPTLDFGSPCLKGGSPYIGNCSFDGAGRALSTLLGGDLNPPVESKAENLFRFSQVPFYSLDRQEFSSLAEYGYIYLPTKCQSGVTSCHLHFSFHGCLQSEQVCQEHNYEINYSRFNVRISGINLLHPQDITCGLNLTTLLWCTHMSKLLHSH